jgi:hypothetical protein
VRDRHNILVAVVLGWGLVWPMIGVCNVWNGYFGSTWYWDPYNGSDGNGGTSVSDAVATFSKAQSLATANAYDIIVCYPGNPSGPTIANEIINITKRRLTLHGPGPEFRIQPSSSADHSVTISADSVKIRGIDVFAPLTGSVDGIHLDGYDYVSLEDIRIRQGSRYGLYISNSQQTRLHYFHVSEVNNHGIYVNNLVEIMDCVCCTVRQCGGDGFSLRGTGIDNIRIQNECTQISTNTGYGIYIGTGATHTILDQSIVLTDNATGDLLDDGVHTLYSGLNQAAAFGGAVYIDVDNGVAGTSYPRGTPGTPVSSIADARLIADRIKVQAYQIKGIVTIDQDHPDWTFKGTDPEADSIRLNNKQVNKSSFERLDVSGNQRGTIYCTDCVLDGLTDGDGTYVNCRVRESFALGDPGTEATIINCTAVTPVDLDLVGIDRNVIASGLAGDWTVLNLVESIPLATVRMGFASGKIAIDSTCIGGKMTVAGVVNTIDNSGPLCTVYRESQIQASPGAYQGAVWIDTLGDGSPGTEYPIGTASQPVDNIADAITIAANHKLAQFNLRGAISLTQDFENWVFVGIGALIVDTVNVNGYSIDKTRFESMVVTGAMTGSAYWKECILNNMSGVSGTGLNVAVDGFAELGPPGSILYWDEAKALNNPSIIDVVGPGRAIKIANAAGEFLFKNASSGVPFPTIIQIALVTGRVTIDASCTGGIITTRGPTGPINNSDVPIIDETLEGRHGTGSWQGGPNVDARTELLEMMVTNRLELDDGVGLNWVLYNDDGVTPYLKWPARDKDGLPIVQPVGAPSRRGQAVEV